MEEYLQTFLLIRSKLDAVATEIVKTLREIAEKHELVGLVASDIHGENGCYDVESIYIGDDNELMCHVNYPSFEADLRFKDLFLSEQHQIFEGAYRYLDELHRFINR